MRTIQVLLVAALAASPVLAAAKKSSGKPPVKTAPAVKEKAKTVKAAKKGVDSPGAKRAADEKPEEPK